MTLTFTVLLLVQVNGKFLELKIGHNIISIVEKAQETSWIVTCITLC